MGKVVPARTSLTLHPPFPPTVHQLSRLALEELNVTGQPNVLAPLCCDIVVNHYGDIYEH